MEKYWSKDRKLPWSSEYLVNGSGTWDSIGRVAS